MRAAALLVSWARVRLSGPPLAIVAPGAVRERIVVSICWRVLNFKSCSMLHVGIVQPDGSPPAAVKAKACVSD